MKNQTEMIVKDLSQYVNSFSDKSLLFNAAMSNEHRTLQQSFTKLCLAWLEHVASDNYQTDLRNQASHEIAKALMDSFMEREKALGFTGSTLELMSKPSKHLPLI